MLIKELEEQSIIAISSEIRELDLPVMAIKELKRMLVCPPYCCK